MKKLIPISLLFFSVNGYCDWFKVTESNSMTVYIDDSKITKKDKFIRIWSLHNMNKPEKLRDGKVYQSYVTFNEIDCNEEKSRDLKLTLYQNEMGKGSVVFTSDEISKWSFSGPGTIGDSLVRFSCGFKHLK
ncbi:hypothetical protein ICV32_02950 [Polynucleobacter sp. MWH-UH24A]|uniref:surface-adhesin E family protein n=1 Tax=Polynucleobacter sp. MWH-UH24A TaxID=2689110 RepID=UPI001BFE7284|nr:surface-adhesin E family protein [Polynucleobacter sp. MWH-UH24A]QWD76637.1 hypothetical protein ICV32_02950 [Polynucleobacter sp. MWH-UH24A]